jgi:hypothetical protein
MFINVNLENITCNLIQLFQDNEQSSLIFTYMKR